jgi:hypothetical protein
MTQTVSVGKQHDIHMPTVNGQYPERNGVELILGMLLFPDIAEFDVHMAFLELMECKVSETRLAHYVEQVTICIPLPAVWIETKYGGASIKFGFVRLILRLPLT